MMSDKMFKVLIIGCGNIAGGFDMALDDDSLSPYTHAGAFRKDSRFLVTACVDPNEQVRTQFMSYWSVSHGFSLVDDVVQSEHQFDIVSICSPTSMHKQDILTAIELHPRLIFCEKPVTMHYAETMEVVSACEKAGVTLVINHNRRWDPDVLELKSSLESNSYGELRSVIGYYNKGTLNNGSHLIDLLHYLLGELKIIATSTPLTDLTLEDPTIPALLCSKEGVPVHLVTGNANDFSLFELQIIFSTCIVTMRDGGLKWHTRKPIESGQFSGYKVLNQGELQSGAYEYTMLRAVDNIYEALTNDADVVSTGETASRAQKLCEQIIDWQQS